mgnify:CR=1 FL=1
MCVGVEQRQQQLLVAMSDVERQLLGRRDRRREQLLGVPQLRLRHGRRGRHLLNSKLASYLATINRR